LTILKQIHGETVMSWTAFVVEMKDGTMYSFGTTFCFEFFDLPQGYSYTDIRRVHSGMIYSLEQGLREFSLETKLSTTASIPMCPHSQVRAAQGQLTLYGLAEILNQMKTVRHLFGLGRTGPRVAAIAIPADGADFGMRQQLVLHDLGGVLVQQIDYDSAFQVHYNGAVVESSALGPFIQAHNLCGVMRGF
jgi:hypothetical protein